MEYFKIDGKAYNVVVKDVSESFTILYSENTGRTLSVGARMILDPLGTFYGHKVTFQRKNGHETEFDELFNYISTPRPEGLEVELIHGQTILKYDAYVSSGERALKKINPQTGVVYWDSISVNFVPMEAQVT